MLAAESSTHLCWSFNLGTFIMVNVLEALVKKLRGDHRFKYFYQFFIERNLMQCTMQAYALKLTSLNDKDKFVELARVSIAIVQ